MRLVNLILIVLAAILIISACAPQATPTPVDVIGTKAAELAQVMLTQTAGAYTSTPLPPTITLTPSFTETSIPAPTSSEPPKPPRINVFTPCWKGPGPDYLFITNICWVEAAHVNIDPNMDLSWLPVMTPEP